MQPVDGIGRLETGGQLADGFVRRRVRRLALEHARRRDLGQPAHETRLVVRLDGAARDDGDLGMGARNRDEMGEVAERVAEAHGAFDLRHLDTPAR